MNTCSGTIHKESFPLQVPAHITLIRLDVGIAAVQQLEALAVIAEEADDEEQAAIAEKAYRKELIAPPMITMS